MKFILSLCIALLACTGMYSQNTIGLSIRSNEQKQPLTGASATIIAINKTVVADSSGLVIFNNIPAGSYTIIVSYVGLKEQQISVQLPRQDRETISVWLAEKEEADDEVIVTSTRSGRSITDIPARVETISGEELTEKGNMKPGDIRMLLNESTGIQTQQTSATSNNSSIRIQGLDGRYTQVLRDGFPLYAGFSGGLSLMQVAPLDLKQIEVIKGSASTLYDGGAIAGLVNLISKTPGDKREINFLVNGTSAGGLDISGFYSQHFKGAGTTVFASRNTARAYDPANIGFTAIPQFQRTTINPKLFIYGNNFTANAGFGYITENRIGGSLHYIHHGTGGYFEKNNTDRFTTQAALTYKLTGNLQFQFKNSYSHFRRFIQIPSYTFKGLQQSSFSEFTVSANSPKMQWVFGSNFLTDDFKEDRTSSIAIRNYHYNTIGVFIQNNWTATRKITIESGLRGDYVQQYGVEWLPRVSLMLKATPKLIARLGGGLGYKTPTVFNEEAEKTSFQNILPINEHLTQNERSAGGNFDVNYRISIAKVSISINQLFFYTKLYKPLVLTTTANNNYQFLNAGGNIDTKGIETNLRFTYHHFKLFAGYTYADVNSYFNNEKGWFPLTAKHRLNNVLMYEQEGKLKIGLEAYYYSRQKLHDNTMGRSYWTFGLMGEKTWKHLSLFINFENFTDTRQTKFDTIYTGEITNPVFRDIYAPVDGFVVNGGIKIRL